MEGEVDDFRPDLKPPPPDYLLPTVAAPLFEFLSSPRSSYAGFQGKETP
jgi:hypothetical protein